MNADVAKRVNGATRIPPEDERLIEQRGRARAAGNVGRIRDRMPACPQGDASLAGRRQDVLIPRSFAAVPPRIARRSSSLNPGVLSTRSAAVFVHG
jgi:hypothetical protein